MKRQTIGIRLTTLAPTLLSSGPQAHNLLETMDVVPGNTVRGVVAHKYLEQDNKSPRDNEFSRLFLTGETLFDFAAADGSEPVPLSARSCKYDAGFLADGKHGVVDLLVAEEGEKTCAYPECGKSIDYLGGFWDPAQKKEVKVQKRLIARTAIDAKRGVAAEGSLYSLRCIEQDMVFRGEIQVPEDLAGCVETLLSRPFTAGVGKGRSRGLGWVRVEQVEPKPLLSTSASDRFAIFKQRRGNPVLAVTLLSDAIFQDKYLRDKTAPDVFDLASLCIDPGDWQPRPAKAFASTRMVFGFDGYPLQLPRAPRLAVAAGSAFLFEPKNGATPKVPEGNGVGRIGEVNAEGFGKAVLWHSFHCASKM